MEPEPAGGNRLSRVLIMLRLGLTLWLGFVWLAQAGEKELEARVRLLEQRLSGRALVELMQQMDQLQQEVKLLQGQLEEIRHSNEELQRRVAELEGQTRQVAAGQIQQPASPPPSPPVLAEQAATPPETQAQELPTLPEDPQQAYQKAYETLQAGLYDEAIRAFSAFVKAHPQSEETANAWYWLGEAYYVKRDLVGARQAFEQVVQRFPECAKAPDAWLKLGYVTADQGDFNTALSAFNEVIRKYPGTRAAQQASERLSQIRSGLSQPESQ